MKVCVIGTGYVGIVTGICLAEIGHDVICVDKDSNKIDMLLAGRCTIFEEGLEDLIKNNSERKTIVFTTDLASAIKSQEIIFICVGTPPLPNGKPDLAALDAVSRLIGQSING